jgi:hypothetical protein
MKKILKNCAVHKTEQYLRFIADMNELDGNGKND